MLIQKRNEGNEEVGLFSFDGFDFKRDAFNGDAFSMRKYAVSLGDDNPKAWYWKRLANQMNVNYEEVSKIEEFAFQIGAAHANNPSLHQQLGLTEVDKKCYNVYCEILERHRKSIVTWILCAKALSFQHNVRRLISLEMWKDMIPDAPYLFDPDY